MRKSEIALKLKQAIDTLFADQPNIFEFSSETAQTEWNLAHHLAIEAQKAFPGYDCDLDIAKPNLEYMRPDIVFHKRGDNDHNLLVIEVKRDGYPSNINNDVEKIRSIWFGCPLRYRFGAVINLKSNMAYEIKVLQNAAAMK